MIIAGGTGVLGKLLSNAFIRQGWEVVVLSRSPADTPGKVKHVQWDGCTIGNWAAALEDATAVVNLAGQSINTRYTTKNKKEILASRTRSTAILGKAISRCHQPPAVWINAGGISGFEPTTTIFTERDIPTGTGFLAELSKQWEAAFTQADTPATRKVQLRMSPVLLSKGGMLAPLVSLTKWGLGGTVGKGDQYISWIHERDFVKLIVWIIDHARVAGVIHASSPNPVTNAEFMRALRQEVGVSIAIPTPDWAVRLGASVIGTDPQLALDGHRVVSHVLAEAGFQFDFPEIRGALQNLML